MNDREKKETAVKDIKYSIPIKENLIDIIYGIISIVFAAMSIWFSVKNENGMFPVLQAVIIVLVTVFAVLVILQIRIFCIKKKATNDYEYYVASERISKALLTSLKRIHYDKTSYILQSTYGRVPSWHQIDYCENVLVYDVHEYLRRICISLKELIINLSSDYNDDMVTVDIAYCYPIDEYQQKETACSDRPKAEKQKCRTSKRRNPEDYDWKIITSGDHTSSSNDTLHDYLGDEESFYYYVIDKGYEFCNEKRLLERRKHYIWSGKDLENNSVGSAVGLVIELKNDQPEEVFVWLILTITTYGRHLVEEKDSLDVKSFERLFKENVLNCYKTVIESELAQMFIRHGIKERYIRRDTGQLEMEKISAGIENITNDSPVLCKCMTVTDEAKSAAREYVGEYENICAPI